MDNAPQMDPANEDTRNPYAPPKAVLTTGPQVVVSLNRYGPAKLSKRFGNYLIDHLGHLALSAIVTAGLTFLEQAGWSVSILMEQLGFFWNVLFGVVISGSYYIYFESIFGRTPGKWITGTQVVTMSGTKPSFGQIVKRTLSRMVPFEPFSFLGDNSLGWHDRWSGTMVVDIRNEMTDKLSPSLQKYYR